MQHDVSFQLTSPGAQFTVGERVGLSLIGIGVLMLVVSIFGVGTGQKLLWLVGSMSSITAGALLYYNRYRSRPAGIQNDGLWQNGFTRGMRSVIGWTLGIVFTGFYCVLYWKPAWFGGLISIFDPLSQLMRNQPADHWFMYGTFYTFAVLIMGVRMLYRYRHNRYQIFRTISVMFFQLGFAFILPYLLVMFNKPEFYFTYFWPLKAEYLWPAILITSLEMELHLAFLWYSGGR